MDPVADSDISTFLPNMAGLLRFSMNIWNAFYGEHPEHRVCWHLVVQTTEDLMGTFVFEAGGSGLIPSGCLSSIPPSQRHNHQPTIGFYPLISGPRFPTAEELSDGCASCHTLSRDRYDGSHCGNPCPHSKSRMPEDFASLNCRDLHIAQAVHWPEYARPCIEPH